MNPSDAHKAPIAGDLITDYIENLGDWRGKVLARLRQLILASDQNISEEWKWEVPGWSCQGMLVSAAAFKDHVKLNFFHGAMLEDPHGLFNASLEAAKSRAIDFKETSEMDEAGIRALLKAALRYNRHI